MSDFLSDYERKRGRALHHFNCLRDLAKRFSETDRPPVRGQLQPDSAHHGFHVPLERIDPKVGVILGDFIYDTRASLDYLITALIRSTGNEENDSSQFPIYTPGHIGIDRIHQWWDSAREVSRKLDGTPPATKATLKRLQPFDDVPRRDPLRHSLAVLAAMSNRDKHRRLNLLAHRASIDFVYDGGKPVFDAGTPLYSWIPERDERDAYVVSLGLGPEKANMDVYLLATYEIALDEPPEVFGELVEVLTGINQFIDRGVLPVVRSLLP